MSKEWVDWFNYDNLWKQQMWQKLGGGSDPIDDIVTETEGNDIQNAFNLSLIQSLLERVRALEGNIAPQVILPSFNDISISSDYTLVDFDDVSASGRIRLKLPSNPSPDAEYLIGNDDGVMKTIDGNGKKIRRKRLTSTLKTKQRGTRLHFRYKIDIDEYVLI